MCLIKANVDKAMQSFIAMLEADPDSLQAVLGMATGFMVEKSQHKARNLLKRIAKMEQKSKDGMARLLATSFYIFTHTYPYILIHTHTCSHILKHAHTCS